METKKLLAYTVTSAWCEGAVLVFAPNQSKAKSLASHDGMMADIEFIEMRCKRSPDADEYANEIGESVAWCGKKRHQEIMRELGWHQIDGGSYCDCCSLHEWDMIPESFIINTIEGEMCKVCAKDEGLEPLEEEK